MDRHDWDERYVGSELLWTAEPNRFLVAEIADLPPGRALDLACGEGRNAVWLARQGWDVVGVDFSRTGLDKAQQLADHNGVVIDWVQDDLTAYEPTSAAYDLVVVLYLHLVRPEIEAVLTHAAGALAPGGTLLVVGHDRTNPTEGHGGPQDLAVLYGPDDIVATLPGLVIDKAERVRRPADTPGGPVDAIDVLVRAHAAGPRPRIY